MSARPNSPELAVAATSLAVLAAIAVLWFAWCAASAPIGRALWAQPDSQSYAANRCQASKAQEAGRFAIEGQPGSNGVHGASKSQHPEGHPSVTDWCDLAAQERMAISADNAARWTFWAMVAAWVGVAVLVPTLIYTALAVRVSRRVGQAETRAYLAISIEPLDGLPPEKAKVIVKNHGVTPARNLKWGATFEILPHPLFQQSGVAIDIKGTSPHFEKGVTNSLASGETHSNDTTRSGSDGPPLEHAAAIGLTHRYYVIGDVIYSDVFDEEHFTEFCQSWDPAIGDWVIAERHNRAT